MRICHVVLVLLVLLATLPAGAGDEPTREEVLAALEAFGGGVDRPGGDPFEVWGDDAMPHLEAFAVTQEGMANAPAFVEALETIATGRAAGLFVRILQGKTSVPGFVGAMHLGTQTRNAPFLQHLLAHEDFKDAVLPYMRGIATESVMALCAVVGWTDQVPRIRRLLHDPSLEVREAAASALTTLTGETPEIDGPDLRVPRESLVPGLVGEPVYVPRQMRRDPVHLAAMPWFDGAPRLVAAFDAGIPSFGHRAELHVCAGARGECVRWPFPHDVKKLAMAPAEDGEYQLIGLVSQEHRADRGARWAVVGAWGADGSERWSWDCDDRFIDDIALLHGEDAPVGVAVGLGGAYGVQALDLDGAPTWRAEAGGVLHAVRTHAALPGHLLVVIAGAVLMRHGEAGFEGRRTLPSPGLFANRGLLFPGSGGDFSYVLAGKGDGTGLPVVSRFDARGRRLWQAQLPAAINGLTMLEVAGAPRLVLVTTDQGELYVLDDGGALRWRGNLPFARADGGVETEQLAAGEIAPGQHAILLKQVQSCYVIPVRIDRLLDLQAVPLDPMGEPRGE